MKKYINLFFVAVLCCLGCEKEDIPTYSGGDHLLFAKELKDSTVFSFLLYSDQNEYQFPIGLLLSGNAFDSDLEYKIEADTALSTAVEGTHFRLPEKPVFRKGLLRDTCFVTLIRTPDLLTEEKRIVLMLREKSPLQIGNPEVAAAVIRVNDMIVKPSWWTIMVQYYYLGAYSEAKFRAFIRATGIVDLSKASDSEIRMYALQFKYWLVDNPTYDNGKLITVPVAG